MCLSTFRFTNTISRHITTAAFNFINMKNYSSLWDWTTFTWAILKEIFHKIIIFLWRIIIVDHHLHDRSHLQAWTFKIKDLSCHTIAAFNFPNIITIHLTTNTGIFSGDIKNEHFAFSRKKELNSDHKSSPHNYDEDIFFPICLLWDLSQEMTLLNYPCNIFIQKSSIHFPTPNNFSITKKLNRIFNFINRNYIQSEHQKSRSRVSGRQPTSLIITIVHSYVKYVYNNT